VKDRRQELPKLDQVRERISRYAGAGPRYTSYPTAPVWSDAVDGGALGRALARPSADPISVYVHIPYCEKLCTYCACNRVISRDHSVVEPFLDRLELEARRLSSLLGTERPRVQMALGGGTPTYLSPPELDRLGRLLNDSFPARAESEASVEVDPRVTTREQLAVLAGHGFNRISLGVQDLSPRVQQAIRRVQSVEETERVATWARELGYRSVHFDLIYGLPFQTLDSFAETLEQVTQLRPDRIALYSYAHVTWVSKQQRGFERHDLPSPEQKLELFLLAIRRLLDAGYAYLGLDHFVLPHDALARAARDGSLRRNFMGYTTERAVDLIALGPSGITELADVYAQSHRGPDEWGAALEAGGLPTLRGWLLSEDDVRRKWLIQELMCAGSISSDRYRSHFGESLEQRAPELGERLRAFEADELLERSDDLSAGGPDEIEYAVTPLGRLFLRNIAMSFDAYLEEPKPDAAPRFSSTV